MKWLKNEQGYALLLVLGMIVVITIIAMPLMNQVISSASQTKITENNIQLAKMIDMGFLSFEEELENVVQSAEVSITEEDDALTFLKDEINIFLNENNQADPISMSEDESFTYKVVGEVVQQSVNDENEVIISYRSEGHVNGKTLIEEKSIVITLNGESEQPDEYDDPSQFNGCENFNSQSKIILDEDCTIGPGNYLINYPVELTGNDTDLKINGDIEFTKEVRLSGNKSTVGVTGNTLFKEDLYLAGNNTIVNLSGNGTVQGDIHVDGQGNWTAVCLSDQFQVEGTIYLNGNNAELYISPSNNNSYNIQPVDGNKVIRSSSCPRY